MLPPSALFKHDKKSEDRIFELGVAENSPILLDVVVKELPDMSLRDHAVLAISRWPYQ